MKMYLVMKKSRGKKDLEIFFLFLQHYRIQGHESHRYSSSNSAIGRQVACYKNVEQDKIVLVEFVGKSDYDYTCYAMEENTAPRIALTGLLLRK